MEPADHATEPDLSISARTGKDFRDDGSFWRPLREAFRFELPTEVLELIHTYYVDATPWKVCRSVARIRRPPCPLSTTAPSAWAPRSSHATSTATGTAPGS